ncbi:uncharacterized protein [Ranitomeya imitator]|uniref:uncharacterized protein isoform X6 n=1 Tax=Ranitomeya imitator TaxID=111125 RepID=UPI0037E7ADD8
MEIRKVMLAVMICAYGQITNTSHDEEFIDPMDMEHYDQSTKSMIFTLKEKKSLELFQGLLQGLLKRADERGLNAVMDIDIRLEINKFLNNENWDSNKMQIILENVVFTDPKDDLEKESVELFKGFLQRLLNSADERGLNAVMDIDIRLEINKFLNNENWDSNKIQIILENVAFTIPKNDLETESVELFKGFLQRLLNSADELGLKAIMDIDIKMEISKFLNNENWDSDKLKIILENVAIPKDKEDWLWTLVVGGVILCILTLLMKLFYWSRPVQTTLPNCAVECTRREIQTKPGTLKDEEESDGALNRNMESFGQTCFCLMSNVEKMEDKNSVKNKAVSHALSSEKKQMVTKLGAKESADKSNYNLELLSSDTEGCSENQVNVDTVLCTHQSQGSSMIVDDESDFIVLSESAPESLTFLNVGACDEFL